MSPAAVTIPVAAWERCRLCKGKLKPGSEDDLVRGVCAPCKPRPEASRLKVSAAAAATITPPTPPAAKPDVPAPAARAFTAADRSLIRAMHGYLSAPQLLQILNDRLQADVGPGPGYTLEQLHREVANLGDGGAAGDDWTSMRRLLNQARDAGVLEQLTAELVDDFAIVFQLTTAQTTHLKDVIQNAREIPS